MVSQSGIGAQLRPSPEVPAVVNPDRQMHVLVPTSRAVVVVSQIGVAIGRLDDVVDGAALPCIGSICVMAVKKSSLVAEAAMLLPCIGSTCVMAVKKPLPAEVNDVVKEGGAVKAADAPTPDAPTPDAPTPDPPAPDTPAPDPPTPDADPPDEIVLPNGDEDTVELDELLLSPRQEPSGTGMS